MKITSRTRMQAVLVGLGAALFFANAAYAQQEVEPTTFESDPAAMQAQVAPAVQSSTSEVLYAAPVAVAAPATVNTASASVAAPQAGSKEWSPVGALSLMASILCLAFLVMRGIADARRERDSQIPA